MSPPVLRLVPRRSSPRCEQKCDGSPGGLANWPKRQEAIARKLNRLIVLYPGAVVVVESLIDNYLADVAVERRSKQPKET